MRNHIQTSILLRVLFKFTETIKTKEALGWLWVLWEGLWDTSGNRATTLKREAGSSTGKPGTGQLRKIGQPGNRETDVTGAGLL